MPNCKNEALVLSEPPQCVEHISDLDNWYFQVRASIQSPEVDDTTRYVGGALADSQYMMAIQKNPIAEELYQDFKERAEPPIGFARSHDQFVTQLAHFFVAAASNGIVGNVSYNAIKSCVLQVMSRLRPASNADDDRFEEIVRPDKYEEIRRRFNVKAPFVEVSVETVRKIETKYHNTAQEKLEKNPDLLHRPRRDNENDN